jgi:signal transduction histidine kinase
MHLDAQERLAASEAALVDERKSAELREQFIAVLGHDLRNPLASIDAAARVLRASPLDKRSSSMLDVVQNSVRRMAGLIRDVLDFARARLGGGLSLERSGEPLAPMLEHVVAELRTATPDRQIDSAIELDVPVYCDRGRIAQVLSNLLANALTHGSADGPVSVDARTHDGVFELSVSNSGTPIPPSKIEKLFQPFTRAAAEPNQQGLGLGLYIAAEIARAHGGTLDVTSTAERTTFTFRMPTSRRTAERDA